MPTRGSWASQIFRLVRVPGALRRRTRVGTHRHRCQEQSPALSLGRRPRSGPCSRLGTVLYPAPPHEAQFKCEDRRLTQAGCGATQILQRHCCLCNSLGVVSRAFWSPPGSPCWWEDTCPKPWAGSRVSDTSSSGGGGTGGRAHSLQGPMGASRGSRTNQGAERGTPRSNKRVATPGSRGGRDWLVWIIPRAGGRAGRLRRGRCSCLSWWRNWPGGGPFLPGGAQGARLARTGQLTVRPLGPREAQSHQGSTWNFRSCNTQGADMPR